MKVVLYENVYVWYNYFSMIGNSNGSSLLLSFKASIMSEGFRRLSPSVSSSILDIAFLTESRIAALIEELSGN